MTDLTKTKCVVLLSGGQDSTTVLAYAAKKHGTSNVYPLNMYYGQQHEVETFQAKTVAEKILGNDHNAIKRLELGYLSDLADSALLQSTTTEVSEKHHHDESLPASFVPNRNAAFLTVAHSYALKIGAERVYGGMCQEDFSGYPDCRQPFIDLMEIALNQGAPKNVTFYMPLMYLSKAETFKLAKDLGVLDVVVEDSHTCYVGDRNTKHDWGYGCGECPACEVRKNGWEGFVNSSQKG